MDVCMTVLAREKLPAGRMLVRGQARARRPGREARVWCGVRERAVVGGVRWQPTLQEEVPVVLRIVVGLVLTVAAAVIAGHRLWWLGRLGRAAQPAPERLVAARVPPGAGC